MRKTLYVVSALAAFLVALVPTASAGQVDHQKADVVTFDAAEADVGDSHLLRDEDGVHVWARVRDDVFAAGDTVTLWWVVWNDWENCPSGACGSVDADFEDPDLVGLDLGYASGKVVQKDGKLQISATLAEGALSGFPAEWGITSGDGLIDAETAEIHIVVRTHGPSQDGYVADQIGTFMGGCDYTDSGLPVGAYGAEGEAYPCFDTHFAIFDGR